MNLVSLTEAAGCAVDWLSESFSVSELRRLLGRPFPLIVGETEERARLLFRLVLLLSPSLVVRSFLPCRLSTFERWSGELVVGGDE